MATIRVDDRPCEAREGDNLLDALLGLGFDVPYFCWHPALGSVGACRLCAIKLHKNERDARGAIVMSCMTPVADGQVIRLGDPEVLAFRRSVIEWLMTNHPHDCPVCDEGGQCHLQDMTVMTGHVHRAYRFPKRTYRSQDLGPCLHHEMNRCIQCYRCVRFYGDYAGGRDLAAMASRNRVYFGRHASGMLESEFSGNLAEVCPTGVFTDKTARRHYARKWDLTTAPSVCVHCGVGCDTFPSQRYDRLVKVEARYHREINGYFLCDRGRYGGRFVDSDRRVRRAILRDRTTGEAREVSPERALDHARSLLAGGAVGIGSPRASLEANFALRDLVGADRFFLGLSAGEHDATLAALRALREGPARTPTVREIGEADAALVLGEDAAETAPVIALALRQMARGPQVAQAAKLGIPPWHDYAVRTLEHAPRAPLVVATTAASRLAEFAAETHRAAPDDLARLGHAVARAIDPSLPEVAGLGEDARALAARTADALKAAERPLVLSGTGAGSAALVRAAAAVAFALCRAGRDARLAFVVPECDAMGLALLGGRPLADALALDDPGVAIVLENDLFRRAGAAEAFLQRARAVIAIDSVATATTARADLVLPAATYAEADGTLVSGEGRAQRFFRVFEPTPEIRESWRWIDGMRAGGPKWKALGDVLRDLAAAVPLLAGAVDAAPSADSTVLGRKVPRQPPRFSGRASIHADVAIQDRQPPDDPDAPLAFTMEGAAERAPSALLPFAWAPGWNSPQAWNKFQREIGGPLRGGDPGVRLIEPAGGAGGPAEVPAAFEPRDGAWLLVPRPSVFGSDELAILEPAVAERAGAPSVALSPADAAALGAVAGETVEVSAGGRAARIALALDEGLPRGVAALSAGFPETAALPLPAWAAIRRAR